MESLNNISLNNSKIIDDHIRVLFKNVFPFDYVFVKTKACISKNSSYFYPIVRKNLDNVVICEYGFYYNQECQNNLKENINKLGNHFYQKDLKCYQDIELDLFINFKPIRGNIIMEKIGIDSNFESMNIQDITWLLNQTHYIKSLSYYSFLFFFIIYNFKVFVFLQNFQNLQFL